MKATSSNNKRILVILLIVLSATVIGLALWRPLRDVPNQPIRVGYLPIYVDLPFFLAVKERKFDDLAIAVEPIRFESSPNMAAALVNGQIDAVVSIATSSALAVESRDPGKFAIFLVDAEDPEHYLSSLVVAADSTVSTVEDLRGRTIGSFPGPTATLFGPLALERLGLGRDDYTLIELPIGSHNAALNAGRIDAVITYEPTATQAVQKFGARKLVPALIESNVIHPWQAGIWIIRREYLAEHPKESQAFVRAVYQAVDLLRGEPHRSKMALTTFTSIELEIAWATPDIPFTKVWEADLVTLQQHADLLTKEGILARAVDIPSLMMDVQKPLGAAQ